MFIPRKSQKTVCAEAYRTLRTNIQYSSVDKKVSPIVVTSAEPAEGKSTISGNVALTFAEDNKKVLLVDCDLRKPSLHKKFRISNMLGLTDVLIGKEKVENVVSKYDNNLDILTSGKIPPNPAEMLGSQNMMDLLEELKKKYDIIVLDTAPLQAVTDAQILSTKVDGTILVIRANKTKKDSVLLAKELLNKVGANILGIVFNATEAERGKYYHYYGNSSAE